MNREGIRRLAAEELGLATSPYRFASSLEELKAACAEIGFPNVVKPVMSSSGKGQSKLDSAADVEAAWRLRCGRRARRCRPRDRRRLHRLRLRDHAADRARDRRGDAVDPLLRTDRPQAGARATTSNPGSRSR
jgi:hypothetical protein